MNNIDLSLYLVTDRGLSLDRPIEYVVEEAVKGGVTVVQLREKNITSKEFYNLALSIKETLKPYKVPLIINDRLDIALAVNADGLHIGQSDIHYDVARRILGEDKIIGLSVETVEQAREAQYMDVDYIGISPVFSTDTKNDISTPLGLEGIKEIASFSRHKIVAIGGINIDNTADVMISGSDGIAVVTAIVSQEDVKASAKKMKEIINQSLSIVAKK
ncbi:MAG: thiamine phosphate synthase [Hyphomicrobiales bacterium]